MSQGQNARLAARTWNTRDYLLVSRQIVRAAVHVEKCSVNKHISIYIHHSIATSFPRGNIDSVT